MLGAGLLQDLLERADVVPVAVSGEDRCDGDAVIGSEGQQGGGVRCGVDKQRLIPCAQEVAVVVHLGHGNSVQL